MPRQMGSFLDDYMTGLADQGDPMDPTGFTNNPDQEVSAVQNWQQVPGEVAAIPGSIVSGIENEFGSLVSGVESGAISVIETLALFGLAAFIGYELLKEFDRA